MAEKKPAPGMSSVRGAWSLALGLVRDPDLEDRELAHATRRMLSAESAFTITAYCGIVLFVPIGLMVNVATAQLGFVGLPAFLISLAYVVIYGFLLFLASYFRRRQVEGKVRSMLAPVLRELSPVGSYPNNPLSVRQWRTYREAKKGRMRTFKGMENKARSSAFHAATIHRDLWNGATPLVCDDGDEN